MSFFSKLFNSGKATNAPEVSSPSSIEVIVRKNNYTILYQDSNKTILEALRAQDIKVPFSCAEGLCFTCSGKLKEGQVVMPPNTALSTSQEKEGYVLICKAKPTTEKVIIDLNDSLR